MKTGPGITIVLAALIAFLTGCSLIKTSSPNGKTNNNQTLTAAELNSGAVKTNNAVWQNPLAPIDHSASVLHTQLDNYNNNGTVFGWQFANDGDFTV